MLVSAVQRRLLDAKQGACRPEARRGVVLLAVLVVVVLLSLAAYHYSDFTMSEYQTTIQSHRLAQARAVADSGVHYAAAALADKDFVANVLGGNVYDNPESFLDVLVGDDGKSFPGRFTLIAPPEDGGIEPRFGVVDETGKINLNALMRRDSSGKRLYYMLSKLPNMTEDVAAAIIDWLDQNSEPWAGGAESDYYSGLSPSYRCKNGPLDSLEELLLVRGVTPELLYGKDRNRNGVIDPDEDDGSATLDRGWSAFLTIYSREKNVDDLGQPLLYIGSSDMSTLYDKLAAVVDEDLTKFIVLYRQYGPMPEGSSADDDKKLTESIDGNLSDLTKEKLDLKKKGSKKISSYFDLVGAKVSVAGSGKDPETIYTSPLADAEASRDLLPKLFQTTTLSKSSDTFGRINVNTAPPEVLAAIPDLSSTDVDAIMAHRPPPDGMGPDSIYLTPAWLFTEANLTAETLRKMERFFTTRSQVYRVQSIGKLEGTNVTARIEAIIDTNAGKPRILAWRDLTELGKGTGLSP